MGGVNEPSFPDLTVPKDLFTLSESKHEDEFIFELDFVRTHVERLRYRVRFRSA